MPEEIAVRQQAPDRPTRRRPRTLRALLVVGSIVVALTLLPFGGTLYASHRLDANLTRTPSVFTGLSDRPEPVTGPAADAVDILVLGTDRRSDVPTTGSDAGAPAWVPGAQRTDTMMLLHFDADRRGASVVSIPRDSWVDIPGHGRAKINAAYSLGGPRLAVRVFERLTGVRLDHVVVLDWTGFAAITDAVGGVTVEIPRTVHDSAHDITWTEGRQRLDGRRALDYVRQRHGLPGGDLARVRRQQALLRELMRAAVSREVLASPTALYGLLDTLTRHVSVDDTWHLRDMAALGWSLRSLEADDVIGLTAPVAGFDRVDGQSVVRLDRATGRSLWQAVRRDEAATWAASHPDQVTPGAVD